MLIGRKARTIPATSTGHVNGRRSTTRANREKIRENVFNR
jgi:hypothetical protein